MPVANHFVELAQRSRISQWRHEVTDQVDPLAVADEYEGDVLSFPRRCVDVVDGERWLTVHAQRAEMRDLAGLGWLLEGAQGLTGDGTDVAFPHRLAQDAHRGCQATCFRPGRQVLSCGRFVRIPPRGHGAEPTV